MSINMLNYTKSQDVFISEKDMEAIGEIFAVPFFGQGHLFPTIELCKHLSLRHYKTTLIIPTHLSSSIPSSFRQHVLTEIVEIASPPPPEKPEENGLEPDHIPGKCPFDDHHQQMGIGIESFLSTRLDTRPTVVIMDIMMSWSLEVFAKFNIPAFAFMTSGACSSAMRYAGWKAHAEDMKPREIRYLPGLPKDMPLTYADLEGEKSVQRLEGKGGPPEPDENGGPPNEKMLGSHKRRGRGPPGPGEKPRWLDEVDGSLGLFINTSDDLEHPFLNYITNAIEKPVWGVGPLLPEPYWKSASSLIQDHKIRTNRKSNYTEDEVLQWLERKSYRSVIYISFGSEVGPTMEEYSELANALEESNHPFIWVVRPGSGKKGPPRSLFEAQPSPGGPEQEEVGYFPHGLANKVGDRGMIIHGWAPQLLILSHKSTGGFLSHCGWNSTVEAMGRGVPLLAWPIRGDQFYNAKLVVSHLKVGRMIPTFEEGPLEMVKKDDIMAGIEMLMADEEVHKQAITLCQKKFESGFPSSSEAALDDFVDFIGKNAK